MNISRSASSTARCVCARICASTPRGFSMSPPVSMTTYGTGPSLPKPYWRSRVSPGTSATMASRVPVSTLNSVDLPTFGRPTSAMTGNMAAPARGAPLLLLRGRRLARRRGHRERLHAIGIDLTAIVDGHHDVARHQRLGADAGTTCRDARRQRAARLVEPVEIALKVTGDDGLVHDRDRRQTAVPQRILPPDLSSGARLERRHHAVGIRDVQRVLIDRQPAVARVLVRPPHLSGVERQHGDLSLEADGVHVAAGHAYRRIDVIEPLELGAPVRRGH